MAIKVELADFTVQQSVYKCVATGNDFVASITFTEVEGFEGLYTVGLSLKDSFGAVVNPHGRSARILRPIMYVFCEAINRALVDANWVVAGPEYWASPWCSLHTLDAVI